MVVEANPVTNDSTGVLQTLKAMAVCALFLDRPDHPPQISTLKFWINLEPLDYFHLIGTARGGRSNGRHWIVLFAHPPS